MLTLEVNPLSSMLEAQNHHHIWSSIHLMVHERNNNCYIVVRIWTYCYFLVFLLLVIKNTRPRRIKNLLCYSFPGKIITEDLKKLMGDIFGEAFPAAYLEILVKKIQFFISRDGETLQNFRRILHLYLKVISLFAMMSITCSMVLPRIIMTTLKKINGHNSTTIKHIYNAQHNF